MEQKLVNYLLIFLAFLLTVLSSGNCFRTFDFIIVGAGAGGCAVARRLTENGNFSVLLLEAGDMPKPDHDIPAFAPEFVGDPDVTFQFKSIPQQHVRPQIVEIVAGRMLGGTTSLNFMWFNRGHPRDWDNWARDTGDDSWKYENMLKYFKRAETYEGGFPSMEHHGQDGPITVSSPSYTPGLDIWLEAGKELGYPVTGPNGQQMRSFTPVEFSKRHGRRVSSFAGYLTPILDRTNLQIITNTTVTRIIFDGNRAVGVSFLSNGTSVNVAFATKEVIISAGAYNSPLILQRSGIGPRRILRAANIPLIKNLPTGTNFQDHNLFNINFLINNASVVMDEERDLTPENRELFNNFGEGPYSSTRGATGQALISSSVAEAEGNMDWPDVLLCMSHSTKPYAPPGLDEWPEGTVPISSSVFLGRPKSRGSVSIDPTNPMGNPIINLGWLRDSRDFRMFLDGIRETLRIYEESQAYSGLQPRFVPLTLPACDRFKIRSNAYWKCYIAYTMRGGCHPAGTNKMGRSNETTSVVDSELRVIGIEGLRVVDASVMPFIVNANPQAAVYAIAEKAADMILSRWL